MNLVILKHVSVFALKQLVARILSNNRARGATLKVGGLNSDSKWGC